MRVAVVRPGLHLQLDSELEARANLKLLPAARAAALVTVTVAPSLSHGRDQARRGSVSHGIQALFDDDLIKL